MFILRIRTIYDQFLTLKHQVLLFINLEYNLIETSYGFESILRVFDQLITSGS